jgi:hypothetical protein
MQRKQCLLPRGLERDKAHCGAAGGFAHGLRIDGAVSCHRTPTNCSTKSRGWWPNGWHLRASQFAPAQATMATTQAVKVANSSSYCLRVAFLR